MGAAPAWAAPDVDAPAVVVIAPTGDAATAAEVAAAVTATGLVVLDGPAAQVLRGRALDDLAAERALAEAQDGFGQLDCGRARPAAETAVRLLAGRAAAGLDERARLTRAWSYLVLCADKDGDGPVARLAAAQLRGLGDAAAMTADLQARYPDIDAHLDRDIVPVTIAGPAGGVATVDDRVVGPVPATAYLAAGKHLVAVASGATRGAAFITVLGRPLAVTVEAPALDDAVTAPAVAAMAAWAGGARVDSASVGRVLADLDVELAAVVQPRGALTLWHRQRGATARIASGAPPAIAAAARGAYDAAHERAPAPDDPLLRDPPRRRSTKATGERTTWWVYAAIGGALVAGTVAIFAADAGPDRQRFVLDVP
ncbi:MAG: hypothetical protein R3B06_08695 [Kofleriaceae bacterium]